MQKILILINDSVNFTNSYEREISLVNLPAMANYLISGHQLHFQRYLIFNTFLNIYLQKIAKNY